ncbi:MAG TPA: glycosyl transferase [Lentisphaeria bacterium]|nr:MAG: hypothetical protein A2X48_06900 [Lentisphaerae bacterium GWF2_49_21]HBC87476.1 glycosyl transferase [Lentisphaeria bacterium]
MGYEILGTRILAPVYGSEIFVWGAIISVFLAGLCIGYAAGGRIADKRSDIHILSRIILVPSVLIVLTPYYAPWMCNIFKAMNLDTRLGALLLSIVLFLVPCIFMGAVIPIIVKAIATNIEKVGSSAGNVYSISTAGSIAGTLFTSFYLISWMGVLKGIQMIGIIVAACWFLCLYYHYRNKKRKGQP